MLALSARIAFRLTVLYGQVHACRVDHAAPGSLWTEDHVAQGFAWRPEAVSFGVPDHDDDCLLTARVAEGSHEIDGRAIWAIRVPFESTAGTVEVGGIAATRGLELPIGAYALTFEALPGEDGLAYELRMTFILDAGAGFAILRRGGEIGVDVPLRLDAQAA